jgi:hypothetical protein
MPAIGQDHAARRRDRFLGEAGERGGREVGHDSEPDPPGAVAANLDRPGHDRLLAVALPATAPPSLDPTGMGLAQLRRARKPVALGSRHRKPKLLQHRPGRLVASKPKLALQLHAEKPGAWVATR